MSVKGLKGGNEIRNLLTTLKIHSKHQLLSLSQPQQFFTWKNLDFAINIVQKVMKNDTK
jgi:hypothetical protein